METETVFKHVLRLLKERIFSILCFVKGHDWRYIGVWNGSMTWQCRRCNKIEQVKLWRGGDI